MSWETILKRTDSSILKIMGVPNKASILFPVLMQKEEYDARMEKLREIDNPNEARRIRGVFDALEKPIEEYYNQYSWSGDATLEEFTERFNAMKELVSNLNTNIKNITQKEAVSLLKETYKLIQQTKIDEAKEKFAKIKSKMPKFVKRNEYWAGNIELQQLYLVVNKTLGSSSYVFFENPPKNKEILGKIAEILDGEVSEDKILTNFTAESQYLQKLKENRDFYSKNMRNLKPKLVIEGKEVQIQDNFFISDKKYNIIGNFDENSVFTYIDSLNSGQIKGSIETFLPKTFKKTREPVPKSLWSREGNRAILNPYASYILKQSFGEGWFSDFFSLFRREEIMSKEEAFMLVLADVTEAILNNENASLQYNIDVTPYLNDRITGLRDRNDKEGVKKAIKDLLKKRPQLKGIFEDKLRTEKTSQFSGLEDSFTIKEYEDIENFLEKEGYDVIPQYYSLDNILIPDIEKERPFYVKIKIDDGFDEIDVTPKTIADYLKSKNDLKLSDFGGTFLIPKDFSSFVKQINANTPLREILTRVSAPSQRMEKLKPDNFLHFIMKMEQRALGTQELIEVFKSLADDPQSEEANRSLDKISQKMPKILTDIKTAIIDAFKQRLEDISKNYTKIIRSKNDMSKLKSVIDAFIKNNLIEEILPVREGV